MQIALYYLSIKLVKNVPAIKSMFNKDELIEINCMAEFVAIHYTKQMLSAKHGASSPRHLLDSIYNLRAITITHPVVTTAALAKYEAHLEWLDAELAIFGIFDTALPEEQRQEAAKKILEHRMQLRHEFLINSRRPPGPNFTTSATFATRPRLATLVNGRSLLLWHVMGHTLEDLTWMEQPVALWLQFPKFRELNRFVTGLSVVNDPAER